MEQNETQVCPWCAMEIIWDPEFGPEEECPHCLNELKGYRSLPLGTAIEHESDLEHDNEDVESDAEAVDVELLDTDTDMDDRDDYESMLAESKAKDTYHEGVMQCLDTQLEVPECFRCQELMLLAGVQKEDSSRFIPEIPVSLGQSFLPKSFELQLYVCPSCFTTESMLSPADRERMMQVIKGNQ
ncbi:MAG: hypothetical protein WD469_03085 [Paenibacillaceae bacterium]